MALARLTPERRVPLATGADDLTGRLLDLYAPLPIGAAGLIYGAHGAGLTRALRSVVGGIVANAPDVHVAVLLAGVRGEEATDWRRRFPSAEMVVAPSALEGAASEEIVAATDELLEAAEQRVEQGEHVLLAVDSLTALWGAMLEAEEADAQREADQATARQRVQRWMHAAGWFQGDGGSASLTVVATAWTREVDVEAEEEGELHPHLRLLEHVLGESSWRAPLSAELAGRRLFPAIDLAGCQSRYEERVVSSAELRQRVAVRGLWADLAPLARWKAAVEAVEATPDEAALLDTYAPHQEEQEEEDGGDFWSGWKLPK